MYETTDIDEDLVKHYNFSLTPQKILKINTVK